jgi:DNA-binding NarL/FixJ family response regulator
MKILIADDHPLVIAGVKAKLMELEPGIELVLATSVDELFAGASDDLDLALIDLTMPGAPGLSHIDEIRRRHPALRIVALAGEESLAVMRDALRRGALGVIHKAYSPEVMHAAVRLVLAGGVYVPPVMLAAQSPWAVPQQTPARLRCRLTPLQMDVLRRLLQGKTNKRIGDELGLADNSVSYHVRKVYWALGAHSRIDAVNAARAAGLMPEGQGDDPPSQYGPDVSVHGGNATLTM